MNNDQQKKSVRTASRRSNAAQERLEQIVLAAVKIINARGYNGMSLQAVANEVGITQAGVLHYVGNKQGLLLEVIQHYYKQSSDIDDYLTLFAPGGAFEGQKPKIPEYLRLIVAENANQPELVMLFQTLNTEAMSPESPMHEYFNNYSREATHPSGSRHGRYPTASMPKRRSRVPLPPCTVSKVVGSPVQTKSITKQNGPNSRTSSSLCRCGKTIASVNNWVPKSQTTTKGTFVVV